MSRKYIIVTKVDGKLKLLSLRSNLLERTRVEKEVKSLLNRFFPGRRIGSFIVEPWPLAREAGA